MQSGFDIEFQLNERPHGFITAYRPDYSEEEYRKMEDLLEAEMKYSGLSYVKAEIGYSNHSTKVFCLIDSRYPYDDFVRLMVRLCSKFRQERVLVTKPGRVPPGPVQDRPRAVGRFYNAEGAIIGETKNVGNSFAWEYFSWILGSRLEYCKVKEKVKTEMKDIYNWLSGGHAEFQRKYPD